MLDQFKSVSSLLFIIVINLTLMITVALLIKCSNYDNVYLSSKSSTLPPPASSHRGHHRSELVDMGSEIGNSAPGEKYFSKRAFYRYNPRPARKVAPATPTSAITTTTQKPPLAKMLINTKSPIGDKLVVITPGQSSDSMTASDVLTSSRVNQVNESQALPKLTATRSLQMPSSLEPLLGISTSLLPTILTAHNNASAITVDKLKLLQSLQRGTGASNNGSSQNVLDLFRDVVGSLLISMRPDKCKGHKHGSCLDEPDDTGKLLPDTNYTANSRYIIPAAIAVSIPSEQSPLQQAQWQQQQQQQEQDQHRQPVLFKPNVTVVVVPDVKIPPAEAAAAAAAAAVVVAADITEMVLNEKKADDLSERLSRGRSLSLGNRNDTSNIRKRSSSRDLVEYGVNSLPVVNKLEADKTKAGGLKKISSIIRTAVSDDTGDEMETNKNTGADMIILNDNKVSQEQQEQQQRQAIKSVFSFIPPPTIDPNNAKSIITKEQFAEILSGLNVTSSSPMQASLELLLKRYKVQKVMSFMHFG